MHRTVLREPDLPPLPEDWRLSPVETVAETNPEVLGAATPQGFAFRYIDLSAAEQGHIDWSLVRETVFREAPSRARRLVRGGDVLFGTVRPALQSHAAIPADERGPLVASTGFAVIRAKPEEADGRFLFYCVLSDLFSVQARRTEVGSNYPAVNESDVRTFLVPHPEVSEQRRIAAILDTLDDAIGGTEQIIAKLQQMKQGLLHDLLTRGVDENGYLRPRSDEAPHLYKDSPLGRIPRGWEVKSVRDSGSVQLGRQRAPQHEKGSNLRPYLRVANVFDGWIDYSDVLVMNFNPAEQTVFRLEPGDILLNEGQSLELVGRSAIYKGDPGAYCFQNTLVRFRARPECVSAFARATFKYWLDTGRFMKIARQTTSVAHLGADRFARMPMPLPMLDEQRTIHARLAAHDIATTAENGTLEKLHALKRGLLHDLLTGRVRVPVPAEVPA